MVTILELLSVLQDGIALRNHHGKVCPVLGTGAAKRIAAGQEVGISRHIHQPEGRFHSHETQPIGKRNTRTLVYTHVRTNTPHSRAYNTYIHTHTHTHTHRQTHAERERERHTHTHLRTHKYVFASKHNTQTHKDTYTETKEKKPEGDRLAAKDGVEPQ